MAIEVYGAGGGGVAGEVATVEETLNFMGIPFINLDEEVF